jgi:hypothetical protein
MSSRWKRFLVVAAVAIPGLAFAGHRLVEAYGCCPFCG